MSMPETPVNENSDPGNREDEVRLAEERIAPSPPGDAVLAKRRAQVLLCRFVPGGLDLRHDPGTFFWADRVHLLVCAIYN